MTNRQFDHKVVLTDSQAIAETTLYFPDRIPFLGEIALKVMANTPLPAEASAEAASRGAAQVAALIESARSGSPDALGQLTERCRRYLLLVANRSLGEDLKAKVAPSDLVQETVARGWQTFDRFTGTTEEELLAWLVGILQNQALHVARQFRQTAKYDISRELPIAEVYAQTGLRWQLTSPDATPRAVAVTRETANMIRAEIAKLPDDYRDVIVRRSLARQSFEEIGVALERSPGAARKLWIRAFAQLRDRLAKNSGQPTSEAANHDSH